MENEMKVFETADQMQLQRILDALKTHQIPTYIKETGAGEYLDISMGYSVYPKEVFVSKGDAIEAQIVVKQCTHREKLRPKEEEEIFIPPWYQNRTIAARILLGILVCVGIISVVTNFI